MAQRRRVLAELGQRKNLLPRAKEEPPRPSIPMQKILLELLSVWDYNPRLDGLASKLPSLYLGLRRHRTRGLADFSLYPYCHQA